MTINQLTAMLTWARARTRIDQRGVVTQGLAIVVLIVLAIIALVLYIVTSYGVHKK